MRTLRRLAVVALALLVLAGVGAALLPMLVGAGLGHGALRDRLGGLVSGSASFDAIEASWGGEQVVRGLELVADDPATRVRVDVVVEHGLLALLRGPAVIEARVAGSATGRVDERGRVSFLDLPAAGGAPDAGGPGSGGGAGGGASGDPARLPAGLRLEVGPMDVTLDVATPAGTKPLRLPDLAGSIAVVPGEPATVELTATSSFDGVDGELELDATVNDLVAADGALRPLAASVPAAGLRVRRMPVPAADAPVLVDSMNLDVSGDLVAGLDLRLRAELDPASLPGPGSPDGAAPRLLVDARVGSLRGPDGVDLANATWTVDAEATALPTGPIAAAVPALAEAGIDLAEDVGPVVQAWVEGGSEPGTPLRLEARGAAARLLARGTTGEGGRLAFETAQLEATVRPALVARHAPMRLDGPARVRAVAEPFTLRPADLAAGRLPTMAVRIASQGEGSIVLRAPGGAGADAELDADATGAGTGAAAGGGLPSVVSLGGFEATVRRRGPAGGGAAPSEVEDEAAMAFAAALHDAVLTLRDVRIEHATATVPLRAAELVAEATVPGGGGDRGPITARLRPTPVRAGEARLATVEGSATLTEGTAVDARLVGLEPGTLEDALGLEPGTLGDWTRGSGDVRLSGRLGGPDAAERAGDAATALDVVLAFPGVDGPLSVALAADGTRAGARATGLRVRPSTARLDALLDALPGTAAAGDAGRPALRIGGEPTLTLDLILEGLPLPPPEGGAGALLAATERLEVDARTTPATLTAAGRSGPLPAHVLGVRGGGTAPLRLTAAPATVDAGGDADARDAEARDAEADGDAAGVGVTAELRVVDLGARPRLGGSLGLARTPTSVLDAIFGTGDIVVASIGSTLDATLVAEDFGRDSGSIRVDAAGSRGRLEGTVRGESGAFVVEEATPLVVTADFHPVLRDRVLSRILPLFGGVSETDGPLTLTVRSAIVPLSDGVDAAAAEFRAEAGSLLMRPGFDFLSVVALFDRGVAEDIGGAGPIEARLEPVSGRLQAGRIVLDATRLVTTKGASVDFAAGSSIDLRDGTMDIRASMPLRWLGSVFREARDITDEITVPLVARGPLGQATLQVAPSFDVGGALVEAGVRGLIERELERQVPGLGDLLRGIGGGGRRDREQEPEGDG